MARYVAPRNARLRHLADHPPVSDVSDRCKEQCARRSAACAPDSSAVRTFTYSETECDRAHVKLACRCLDDVDALRRGRDVHKAVYTHDAIPHRMP